MPDVCVWVHKCPNEGQSMEPNVTEPMYPDYHLSVSLDAQPSSTVYNTDKAACPI